MVGAGKLENRRSGSILGTGDSEFVVGASLNASDTPNVPIDPMDLISKENLVPDSSMNPNFAISDFSNSMSIKRKLARKVSRKRDLKRDHVRIKDATSGKLNSDDMKIDQSEVGRTVHRKKRDCQMSEIGVYSSSVPFSHQVIENRSKVISSVPVVESSSVEKQPALSHSPVFFCFCAFEDVS
ncbi:hypothetical protein L6452_33700 [Arctium lappa]|uniref:Uncharacterized protein n=1 Tax=Arctium lappa TaxID=4217 RepID=A0ACB8YHA2_ARCLA|nr:hypothetical protein L6452_33700 [Arctium lappa]